ncbi:MAG: AgmX/PglI C-terminal domain-containing protein, partial [Deltaproteobacteria bacterium]|nr:AgmX/PglI C-terminal domain-containing protein [Deltaproteobacteria bacterium]
VKLGLKAYGFSGRWSDAVACLDKALTLVGKAAPTNDVPVVRYSQADFTVRLDNPEQAAKYAKASIDALPGCGTKCTPKEQQDLISAVAGIARVFHFVYATSNDVRYFQPANDLYLMTIPLIMDATVRAERNSDAEKLQRTMKNTKAGTGTHDKDAIRVLAERHNGEIQTCYENVLIGNPKLGGNVSLMLESDQTGVVKGASTEPKGGVADMAAVATCVTDAAKTWKLPKRGMPGNSRIKLTYTLSKK